MTTRPESGAPARFSALLRGYMRLPHPGPILIVLVSTAGFALIASDGKPGTSALVRLLLAMFGAQLAIGAVNELVDENLDRRTKPQKPIPAGLVSRRGAITVTIFGGLLMILFSASFGVASLLLSTTGAAIGIAYSLWFKRTPFAWLPYLLALPLLPIWVWTAMDHNVARLLLLYPLGAPAIISIYLAQSLPDIAADRAGHIDNLPVRLGERRAVAFCWGAMMITIAVVALVGWMVAIRPNVVWSAAIFSGALVATDVGLYLYRPRVGIAACFACTAVAGAGLGLSWVLAVTS